MDKALIDILEKVRELFFKYGVRSVSMDDICRETGISKKRLYQYVASKNELVEKLLELERRSFEVIFEKHNFDGVNSIDILLTVSKEVASKFIDVSPSVTFILKKNFPEIYHRHFELRTDFIYEKIKINLTKGMSQGMYRDDLSIELVARLYLSRLVDLHNPDFFPPEEFSFDTIFNSMFESLIRSIAKPEGLEYYEQKRKCIKF